MNKTLLKIKESRPDLSDYLFHFTNCADAKDTLIQILIDGKLKDIGGRGCICFTETPIYAMIDMFDLFEKYPCPMYSPYGIGLPKQKLFDMEGRPVIYGKANEINLLDDSIKWRFERYNINNDFTWLREWRVPAKEITLTPDDCFVITKTKDEEFDITHMIDVDVDGDWADGQWHPQLYVTYEKEWKSISIETLLEEVIDNNTKLKTEIDKQKLGE